MSFQWSFLAECQRKITELQKRVTETGGNVISRTRKWRRMSTVPSSKCDVVLTFVRGLNEDDIQWFIQLLHDRVPELAFRLHEHRTSGQLALYMTACYRDLLIGAEELGFKKRLASEHGGGLREFSMEELDLFDGANDENLFLSSGERCAIVHHYLMGLLARDGDTWNDAVKFNKDQPMIHPLQAAGLIHQIFPVHHIDELRRLQASWVRGWTFRQPLDEIGCYFGQQIALYFAWLGHYTAALLFPSIVGLLVWLFVDAKMYKFYHLVMAILSLLWSIVYLEHWKRTSATLTYQWGIWDPPPALLDEPRAQFKGRLAPCPITGRLVRTYPSWRRNAIICCFTGPIVFVSLAVVVCTTLGFVILQDFVDPIAANSANMAVGLILPYMPKILLAFAIVLIDSGYRHLAAWLTDLENHRLDSEYHSHLVGKLLLLEFMNSFYSLFYTAFYLQDLELLQQQLTTLLITRQIIGNVREIFLPYGQSRVRQFFLSFEFERQKHVAVQQQHRCDDSRQVHPSGNDAVRTDAEDTVMRHRASNPDSSSPAMEDEIHISSQEREATLLPYSGPDEDFLEMFIQFGYVSMFSCVFPVAGVLAFLNNLVEIRGDAFKLIASFQRPFAQRASNIGIWQFAMSAMGYAAVIVNIALLSISGTVHHLLPHLSTSQSLLVLVAIEHFIFVLNYMLTSLIPEAPTAVVQQIAKLEYRRREALRTLERESLREYRRHRSTSRSHQNDIDECLGVRTVGGSIQDAVPTPAT